MAEGLATKGLEVPAVPPPAKFLSLDDVEQKDDVEFAEVSIPQWGGKIRIRSLTAEQMVQFVEENEKEDLKRIAGIRLIIRSWVDGNGNRVCPNEDPLTIEKLKKKNSAATGLLIEYIMKMNRMGKYSETLKND